MKSDEKKIERWVQEFCIKNNLSCHKLDATNDKGTPDRVIGGKGKVLYLEIKGKGEKPEPKQILEILKLRSNGNNAGWVDSIEQAKAAMVKVFDLDDVIGYYELAHLVLRDTDRVEL